MKVRGKGSQRNPARPVWLGLLCVLLAGTPPTGGAEFLAGAAVVDITPQKLPVRIAGGIAESWANEVHDPLHVRGLVLEDGHTCVALAVVDSCMLDQAMLDDAKARAAQPTGIPGARMLISATHTHSAPAVVGCHGTDPHPEYRAWLIGKIAGCITLAWSNRQPARIGWGRADCPDFVFCRRWVMKPGTAFTPRFSGRATNQVQMNPGHDNANKRFQTGPVDPAVTVLYVQTKAGQPLALLANYSTHYAGAPGVSADYFGAFCQAIGQRLGADEGSFVALLSNGTSGDANCIDFSQPKRAFDRFTVAQAVAQAAFEACQRMDFQDWVPLAVAERQLSLKLRLPAADEVSIARTYLAEHVGTRPVRTWEENYARETVLLSEWPAAQELKLQAIRIGGLGIGAIPCEVYGSTGLAIKRQSPFALTMVIGLANGYLGYLTPPEQHLLGGYTSWRARTSCLEAGAEPQVADATLGLLRAVQAGRP